MTSYLAKIEFCVLLVLAAFCFVKPYIIYDPEVKSTYRTSSSEMNRRMRTGRLGKLEEYISNFSSSNIWKIFQDEEDKDDYKIKKLMKNRNKEAQKRGIQALAKNGDFPKKHEKPRLQDMIVTNYTYPANRQYEY